MPWSNLFGTHKVALKIGDLDMRHYEIGDDISVPDGTYIDPLTGVVVIVGNTVVATMGPDQVFNRYGEALRPVVA